MQTGKPIVHLQHDEPNEDVPSQAVSSVDQLQVMRELSVTCFCDADGVVYPLIVGLHEPVLDRLFRAGNLGGISIDALVRQSFWQLINENADDRAELLSTLKTRLEDALRAVEHFERQTGGEPQLGIPLARH